MSLRKVLITLLFLLPAVCFAADETASPLMSSFLAPGKSYDYKVKISLDGESRAAGSKTSQKISAVLDLAVRQKNLKGVTAGEVQSVMSVQSASLSTGGEKIQLAPTTFPQVTVLIDKTGTIKKVFGASGPGMPGLNFSNFMLLLLPNISKSDASELKEGEQWTKDITLNDTGQAIRVVSTFKGKGKVKETDTIVVDQTFEMLAPKEDKATGDALQSLKGTAQSNFLAAGYKPVKSHAQLDVLGALSANPSKTPSSETTGQDKGEFRAKVNIDLEAIK